MEYYANAEIEANEEISAPVLNGFYVYLTAGCNLACQHCWLAPKYQTNGNTGGHLEVDLLRQALDEAIPLGLTNVKLTGGEPLLHPDFIEIVDLVSERELGLFIETNGTLLTPDLAHYLKHNSTMYFMSVSLDGANAQTHDKFRGVKGSFDKTCNAVRMLVDEGVRPQVIMSIHNENVDQMEELVQLAFSLGAGSVKFNLVQPAGRGKKMSERGQTLDIHRLIELGHWVETELWAKYNSSIYYSWPMAFFGLERLLSLQGYSCSLFHMLGIIASGHYAMCGMGTQIPELCYGRIGDVDLKSVWTSHPVITDVRNSIPEKLTGVCSKCILRDRCLGTCVAGNYNSGGSLRSPDWFCQSAYEAGVFPESRLIDTEI